MNKAAVFTETACPICGMTQIWCPSGVTCPNGHGFGEQNTVTPVPPSTKPKEYASGRLNDWAEKVAEVSRLHGFHDPGVNNTPSSWCSNLHGEISEFWEAYRKGMLDSPCDKDIPLTNAEEELADIIIRTLDVAWQMKIDIERAVAIKHAYNETRPYRHGGKLA